MRLSMMEVRRAMDDPRFQASLPESLKPDLLKYLSNPGCGCNHKIFQRVAREAADQLRQFYPGREPPAEADKPRNDWLVINCHVDELEARLRALKPGRKQISAARDGDQVTVIVNEFDVD